MNIGIIGTGGISAAHAMGINSLDDSVARLHSCCDINEKALHKFAKEYRCKEHPSIDRMLDDKDLDGVIICLPHGLHAEIGIKALEKGKHALVEKPMAPDVSECMDLIKTSERTGKKLQAGHEYYLYPAVRKAHEVLDSGELGKPLMIKAELSSYIYDKLGTWWMDPQKARGGPAINMGVHLVDVASYILDRFPRAVRGEARELHPESIKGIKDYFRMEIDFGNSLYADLKIYSFLKKIAPIKPSLIVFCEDGCLSVWSNELLVQHSDGDLELRFKGDPSKAYLVFAEQARQFSEFARKGVEPRANGKYGMMTVACIEGAMKEKANENWIPINDMTGA